MFPVVIRSEQRVLESLADLLPLGAPDALQAGARIAAAAALQHSQCNTTRFDARATTCGHRSAAAD